MSVDHAAQALRLAEMADASYGRIEHRNGAVAVSEGVECVLIVQIAQVHATLALVEQQRIANLIALAKCGVGEFAAEAHHGLGEQVPHPDYSSITVPALRAEVRKGLGL